MSILDVNFGDRQELKILKDNDEVQLRISFADITPNKTDPSRNNLALVFDVPDDPLVDDIRVWLPIPGEVQMAEDPKRASKQLGRLESFCDAFGLSVPLDTDEMVGTTGWAVLSEQEGMNDGEMQNGVRRFVARK